MSAANLLPIDFINDANSLIGVTGSNDTPLNEYALIAAKHLIPQGIEMPKPEIVFEIAGISMLTKKSISLLIAKAKAGKTTVAAWIAAQVIKNNINILWIDTEQGLYYGSRTQSWILDIAELKTSEHLSFYDLKIYPPNIRIELIEALIKLQTWDLIVIDGIRDLVFDINNPEQATLIATRLMRWADTCNCHILTILHVNKGNDNARGHLGSEMVNKAETVIKVSQNDANEIIVEPEFSRGKPFEAFALNRNEIGIPYLIEAWSAYTDNRQATEGKNKKLLPTQIPNETHLEILNRVFVTQSEKKYRELLDSMKNEVSSWYGWPISDAKIRTYIQYYLDQNLLIKTGNIPHTKYSPKIKSTDLLI